MRSLCLLSAFFFLSLVLQAQSPLFERFDLRSNKVFSSISSAEGELFFATSNGVYAYGPWGFKKLPTTFGPKEAGFEHLFEDQAGRVYAFSAQAGLYEILNKALIYSESSPEILKVLGKNKLNEIVFKDSLLWFSIIEKGGLYNISLRNEKISKHLFNNSDEFSYFVYDIGNEHFISGANDAGLSSNKLRIFHAEQQQEIKLSGKASYRPSRIKKLRDGSLVFSLGAELLHIASDRILSRLFQEGKVLDIHEDIEGKLWVAMENQGLTCYPNGLEESSNNIRYLGNYTVTGICETFMGELWISTNGAGVYQFNPGTSTQYEAPSLFSDFDSTYISREAIPLEDMPLVLPGMFNPNAIVRDTAPPEIFITGVKIMGKDTGILSAYELDYRHNFIEINYLGFSRGSSPLQYRYKLEGANEDWVYTSRSLVQYTTLPPGRYVFNVEAVNKDGVWSKNSAALDFTIHPPFWQRTWFRVTIILSFLLLALAIWLFSFYRIRQKSKRREAFNRKMAQIELQALRAQMNPHFLFNTLSSIQHYITLSKSEEAINYLSKFAKLMRVILENSQKPEIPIKDEIQALEIYLDLESLRFKNKFEYRIEIDPNLDVMYDQIPPLLIQPYVENAIMHGIMHLEKKGLIEIKIERSGDFMKVCVKDNGVGRARAKQFDNQKMHKSRGMSITKDRLEIINASRKSNLSLKISDLKDENGDAVGTLVEIYIPLED